MLKVRMTINDNMLGFSCPLCGIDDVLYITMPIVCWQCGEEYTFDITSLLSSIDSRYKYYKYGNT